MICACGHPAPVWVARSNTWCCQLCADGIDMGQTARRVAAELLKARTDGPRARPQAPDLFNRGRGE